MCSGYQLSCDNFLYGFKGAPSGTPVPGMAGTGGLRAARNRAKAGKPARPEPAELAIAWWGHAPSADGRSPLPLCSNTRRGGCLAPLSHLHAAARPAAVTYPAPRRP